jgi:phage shock protein A
MSKRGIIGRVAQLTHANVGAVIDSAENPQQVADQLARDYEITIAEAEQAIAELVENRRIAADDQREDAEAANLWAGAAAATSQLADELRAAGDATAADGFDNLARIALARELSAENDVESSQHTITAQTESVDTLTNGIGQLRSKLSQLTLSRHVLVAGATGARARPGPRRQAVRHVDVMDPAIDVTLFQEAVRQEEARLRERGRKTQAQLPAPRLAEFAGYTGPHSDAATEAEIAERLQALKTSRVMASALARAQGQHGPPLD